jgi:hypothetical protein
MSEKNELKRAISLAEQGKREEAVTILVALEQKIKEPNLRLWLIDASLANFSPIKYNKKLIELAEEAISITKTGVYPDYQPYFMGRKADLLTFQISLRRHRIARLTLTPSWIGFATEAEKSEHDILMCEVETMESESESLLEQALTLAEKSGDKKTKAYILMNKGQIFSSKYLQHKADCLRNTFYGKLWVKFEFGRYPFFENLFSLTNSDIRKLTRYVKIFRESLLDAGLIFEGLDDPSASSAYFNLANELKTAYRFGEAKRFLVKSRAIALKHNDQLMITKIDEMVKIVAAKNKDIPDYLNGEDRNSD